MSRLHKIIGRFFKRALQKRPYSAKETYNFEEPTNRSHPIVSFILCPADLDVIAARSSIFLSSSILLFYIYVSAPGICHMLSSCDRLFCFSGTF